MDVQNLRFVIIDDSAEDSEFLRRSVQMAFDANITIHEYVDPQKVISDLPAGEIDLIFVDQKLAGTTGIDSFLALRDHDFTCPIIMCTGQGTERLAADAIRLGLSNYIVKGSDDFEQLKEVVTNALAEANSQRDRQDRHAKLEALVKTDELTGLANRRGLLEPLGQHIQLAQRHQSPLCLLMVDLDHFKSINDTFGHVLGDSVLDTAATVISHHIRSTDLAARYGGEEFCIVLPQTALPGAQILAEKIRTQIAAQVIKTPSNQIIKITCSIGISQLPHGIDNPADLIELADQALYEAKGAGRNTCRIHVESEL
jgi:two-component system cell cycle response regulator